jgi:uncharacterized membrane protein
VAQTSFGAAPRAGAVVEGVGASASTLAGYPGVSFFALAVRGAMSLADACISEMARVRDHVMPHYYEIGAAGVPALIMMRAALDATARALAEQDAIALLRLLDELKGFRS